MNIIAFSTVYLPDQQAACALRPDLFEWEARVMSALPGGYRPFLVDGETHAALCPISIECIQTGIEHTKPYHCRDWSYSVAAYQTGFYHAMQKPFDIVAFLAADAILGVDLHDICDEFMQRPEVICGPAWFDKIETHFMLLKRQAVKDHLYSLPFVAMPKFPERNTMYYEEALALLFAGRWWNPWQTKTIRQEYGTPEEVRGFNEDILKLWPMLSKASPEMQAAYRTARPLPLA